MNIPKEFEGMFFFSNTSPKFLSNSLLFEWNKEKYGPIRHLWKDNNSDNKKNDENKFYFLRHLAFWVIGINRGHLRALLLKC